MIYPEGCTLVPVSEIEMTDRSREDFGDLQELAEMLDRDGLIHPPTVTRDADGQVKLIAGERRTRAMQSLGLTEIPVLFREQMSELQLRELEFFENHGRKQFTWQEQCIHLAKLHKIQADAAIKDGKSWGYRDTQRFAKCALGHISHALQVAPLILAGDKDVIKQKSLMDAYKNVLLKRKEDEIIERLGRSTVGTVETVTPSINLPTMTGNEAIDAIFTEGEPADVPEPETEQKVISYPLSDWLYQGDFREVTRTWLDGTVDHVVTDIPYGIDMDSLKEMDDIDQVVDAHDVKMNVELMPDFLATSYRLMKADGFCVFWYDLDHHEKLQRWATEAGFKVQRWPLVWHKLHPCKNSTAQYNITKNVEFAMFCRKGDAVLKKARPSAIVAVNGTAERLLYSNPFAKPGAVWDAILETIADPGEVILDPFAGQMSSIKRVLTLGMEPRAIELEKHHYINGIQQVKDELLTITGGRAIFK